MTIVTYLGWMLVLGIVYYLRPGWHIAVWSLIGVSSSAAICYGIWRNRPRRKLPWLLLAAAVLTFVSGDTTYNVLTTIVGETNPYPSLADALYLVTYPLVAAGLLSLARTGSRSRDRAALLDSLIFTLGLGLLAWIYLASPYLHDIGLTVAQRFISIGYPLGDVLILATVARLVIAGRRGPAVAFLVVGGLAVLVTDAIYGYLQLISQWRVGGPVDIGWIVFYTAFGAAALHPTMVILTRPRLAAPGELPPARLILLAVSSLIAPAVLFIEQLRGGVRDARIIAVLSALLFLLVLARLAGVARTLQVAVARERALRQSAGALVARTDAAGVATTVSDTIAALLRPGTPHRVALSVYHSAEDLVGAPARTDLVEAAELDRATADNLAGFDLVLRTPLTVPGRRTGDPRLGALFVAGSQRTLAVMSRPIEVLAAQAALALERIALTAEISRRDSEAYFRTLVHHAADVILIVEDDGSIRYASPSARQLFGEEISPGTPLASHIEVVHGPSVAKALELMSSGADTLRVDWQVRRPDGSVVVLDVSHRDLRRDPTVRGVVITMRDITQQRRLEGELRHRALHDGLTGLANRTLFNDLMRQAVRRARRSGRVVGMIFVDLDEFKVVNDTLGHQMGDELLIAVGRRLGANLREHDTAARLGGDEFGVLIDDATTPREIEGVAERIRQSLSEPFLLGDDLVSGRASLGVATSEEADDAEDLRRKADLALYVAKGAGKGQWRRYRPETHTPVLERLELRAALDTALARNQLELRYQPVVIMATGAAIGFEALLRWNHPHKGLLGPGEFIGAAEESGLIVPIGGWVLRQAVVDAVQWRRSGVPGRIEPPYVSVNVSARQFRAPGFTERVLREMSEADLPAGALMLELTESLLLREDDEVWAHLGTLRDAGVRMAIDDFGTGYSSLGYLRHMPFDVLKLDRSFITSIGSSRQQYALVDGIIRLAETLHLQVIAEGVERPEERDMLLAMGVGYGQGYLFAHPLTAADANGWVHTEEGLHAGTQPP